MAIALVGTPIVATGTAGSVSLTVPNVTTVGGNLLIVAVVTAGSSGSSDSCGDGGHNTYTKTFLGVNAPPLVDIFTKLNAVALTNATITIGVTSGFVNYIVIIAEYSGVSSLDVSGIALQANSAQTSVTTGAISLASNADWSYVVVGLSQTNTMTATSGVIDSQASGTALHLTLGNNTGASSVTWSATMASSTVRMVFTFRLIASAGTIPVSKSYTHGQEYNKGVVELPSVPTVIWV